MSPEVDPAAGSGAEPTPPAARPARRLRGVVLRTLVLLAVCALLGVACGWLWEAWWEPPRGGVVDGQWLYQDRPNLEDAFDGIALYVVVGLLAGLALGVATGLLWRGHELVALLVLLAGSVLAAWLCAEVGMHLGPPDPQGLAPDLPDGSRLPGELVLEGRSPYAVWPLGALLGFAVTLLLTAGADEARRREVEDPRWLTRNPNG